MNQWQEDIDEYLRQVLRLKFWAVVVAASFVGGAVGNILYQIFMAGFCK